MSSDVVDKVYHYVKYILVKKSYFKKWLEAQPRGAASELAKRLGVTRQYVYKISSGEVVLSLSRAEELSKITGMKLSQFSYFETVIHTPRG